MRSMTKSGACVIVRNVNVSGDGSLTKTINAIVDTLTRLNKVG